MLRLCMIELSSLTCIYKSEKVVIIILMLLESNVNCCQSYSQSRLSLREDVAKG